MDGKDRCGETLSIDKVSSSMTILELKERIMRLNTKDKDKNWFNTKSTLMYAGKILDRHRNTLEDYGIVSECDIVFAYWFTSLNVPLPKYKVKLFRKAFDKYDGDKSGEIGADEFYLLVNDLGMRRSRKTCEEMIAAADDDDSGEIDFEEFCQMMVKIMHEDLDGCVLEAMKAASELTEEQLRDRDGGALIQWEPGHLGNHLMEEPEWKKRSVVYDADTDSYVFE